MRPSRVTAALLLTTACTCSRAAIPSTTESPTQQQQPPPQESLRTRIARGIASFYHRSLAGQPTASGEPYDPHDRTCAHRTLPLGTEVVVKLVRTGATATCRINDRGPFVDGRILDLSEGMAEALGVKGDDIHQVELYAVAEPRSAARDRRR